MGQGLRDEPARMRALGFNVTRHRILAFTLAAFVAAIAGILSVWYNRRITPGSINLAQTIDVLIIAVIGGLYRLEGAWVGALTYALLDNYSRDWTPTVGDVLGPERFNTILGYAAPFDRHDWVIDRCGTRVDYVIDFYSGRADGKAGPSFYLDVRPKLNTWEGVKMRAMRWTGLA
jgi:hypothetical protein